MRATEQRVVSIGFGRLRNWSFVSLQTLMGLLVLFGACGGGNQTGTEFDSDGSDTDAADSVPGQGGGGPGASGGVSPNSGGTDAGSPADASISGGAAGGEALGTGGSVAGAGGSMVVGGMGGGGIGGSTMPTAGAGGSANPTPMTLGTLTPSTFDFGQSPANQIGAKKGFEFKNGGNTNLDSVSVVIEGADAQHFVADANPCLGTLTPGHFCTPRVTFFPKAMGTFTATVRVVTMAGSVLASAMVQGTAVTTSLLKVSPAVLDLGTGEQAGVYTITNESDVTVAVSASFEGEGATSFHNTFDGAQPGSSTHPCTRVPPGKSCKGRVNFFAGLVGSAVAVLKFNGGPAGVAALPVWGERIVAFVEYDPASYDFGEVLRGTKATKAIKVRITGLPSGAKTAPLRARPHSFEIESDSCTGRSLGSMEECTVVVGVSKVGPDGLINGGLIISTDLGMGATISQLSVSAKISVTAKLPPADDFLIGFWSFDETLNDSSGLANHAVTVSGTTLQAPSVEAGYLRGKRDGALDASFAWARVPVFTELDDIARHQEATVSMWVNAVGKSETPQTYVSFPRTRSDWSYFTVGEYEGRWRISVRGEIFTAASYFIPGWHHVVAVFGGQDNRLYVDGVLAIETFFPVGIFALDTTPFLFGGNADSTGAITERFKGALDHVRLYSRRLTESEISAEMLR